MEQARVALAENDDVIRLAFCIDNLQIGGTELNAVRWAERLDRQRFRLTLIHFQADGPLRTRYERLDAKLVHLPLRNMYGPGAVQQGVRLARFLRREGIQIFHAHDIYSNIFGVPWARVGRVPAVIASRRWWHLSPRPAQRVANRLAYRAAHRVLANSPAVARLLSQEERVPSAKIACVPNFVADDAFEPLGADERATWRTRLGVPADTIVIGIVARLDRVKDHRTLFQAFAKLASHLPQVQLLCLGDGPDRVALTTLARTLLLEGRIHLPGTVTPPFNPHTLFDVSVLCSLTEGFPNSIVEAMAAARPVVATRVGGVPDAVRDGETGVLVPAGDADALAVALTRVIQEGDRAHTLGLAAQAHVRKHFHATVVVEQLQTLYTSLARFGRG